jgi:hypothetical protein
VVALACADDDERFAMPHPPAASAARTAQTNMPRFAVRTCLKTGVPDVLRQVLKAFPTYGTIYADPKGMFNER